MKTLSGVRVAITGGTSGLGLALVEALTERGATVAFLARDAERVAAVAAWLDGTHGIVGDVARKDTIHPIALELVGRLGGVDVLINNASSLATNLVGPFRLTKALLGSLAAAARDHGAALVVNLSSDAAVTPYAGWGAYGASKAALLHLSRIWDAELAPYGIRVEAVDPGDMDTPLHAVAVPDADRSTLKQPADAAREIAERIEAFFAEETSYAASGRPDPAAA
jgi:NAD(P)-dependent dehydrogenase (short-subunit alcohol dehydrogenase family)